MRYFAFFVLSLFAVASLADAPRPASNNAKIFMNNDGTATIELPFFNASHFLSLNSNLDGVCKLFGLGHHIPYSLIPDTTWAQIVANVDVRSLDQGHVIPNMGPCSNRGIWYPFIAGSVL